MVSFHLMESNWIQMGILNPSDYVSHVYNFDDIDKAFENIKNKVPMMKMVIKLMRMQLMFLLKELSFRCRERAERF